MKKSLGGLKVFFPGGRILLGFFFLLSLSSCGMGGGGAGGSFPPSSTFSASNVTSFGTLAVDHGNNNVWVATNTGLLEIPAGANSCATTFDCPLISLGFTPAGIAVDSNHNVWVTDSSTDSVTKIPFTSNTYPSSCSPPSSCPTFSGFPFSSPTGIAVDTSGNVWVTNDSSTSGSVTEIPYGTNLTSCSSGCTTFSGSSYFSSPTGIAVDSQNNIWVTNDTSPGWVTEIPSSAVSSASCSSSSCPTYSGFSNPVAVSLTGSTPWVANSGTGGSYPQAIVEIISSCTSSGCPEITHFTQPVGLAFDSSGNLWVIDAGTKTTVEITASAIASANCSSATPCYQYPLPATPEGIATNSQGIWISLSNAQVIEYKP
jgi:streptogramin lyase